jgi:hypothetical protein
MRQWTQVRARRKLVASLAAVAAAWSIGCAGTPASRTVPRCPTPSPLAVLGLETIIDAEERGVPFGPFLDHYEDLQHYCLEILPAWIGD